MNEQLRACVYGLAVGDALGVPFEFMRRGTFECAGMVGFGAHAKPKGTWSDDTSMTLATCESIKRLGRIDPADIMNNFRRWLFEGAFTADGVFDVGRTCSIAIREGRGQTGEYDNGNGALMRIAPIAFTQVDEGVVDAVSSLTHAHSISMGICRAFVQDLRDIMSDHMSRFEAPEHPYTAARTCDVTTLASGGFVRDTYRAAWYCITTTSTYKDAVLKAVNLGDDSDTTGAVTGALAGLMYGFEAIPAEWIASLRAKELIESVLW